MEDDHDGQEPSLANQSIAIELTPNQVGRVVRTAAGVDNISILLPGLTNIRQTLAREPELLNDPKGSRSLLVGLKVLSSLPSDGSYIGVVELSKIVEKSASTTHRYLHTLVTVGLVEQNPSRDYRLVK